MSELPISSPYRDRPDGPVSEDERNRLTERLNAAYEAGAMDEDEYRTRLDRVWSASRLGELAVVVQGLPPAPTHAQPAIVTTGITGAGRPGELAPIRRTGSKLVLAAAGVGALVLLLIILIVVAL